MSVPMLAAVLAVVLFVLVRVLLAGDGDPSKLVVAGSVWADASEVPSSLFVFPDSSGYDGQFYWRLAVDPTNFELAPHFGVALDVPVRLNRPVYPVLSWALAGGQRDLVPISLIVVNVVALVGLARLGIGAARERGINGWWGLTLLLTPGLVGALSRDLTEVVSVTMLVGGILAMRRDRWALAAFAWTVAGLTRETSAVVFVAYLAVAVYEILRRRRSATRSDLGWAIPLVAMVAWQLAVWVATDTSPLFSSSDANVGPPFVGLLRAVPDWFSPATFVQTGKGTILLLQLVAGAILIGAGLVVGYRDRSRPAEVLSCALACLPVVLGSQNPWAANLDLRLASDAMVIAWLLLIGAGSIRSLRFAAVGMAPVVVLTVAQRLVVI